MGLLSLDVKVGEAVQLGDIACIAFDFRPADKYGRQQKDRLKLRIATPNPLKITLIPTGIIPRFFVTGIAGASLPVVERTPEHSPA